MRLGCIRGPTQGSHGGVTLLVEVAGGPTQGSHGGVTLLVEVEDDVVKSAQLVSEIAINRVLAEPHLTGGDAIDVELRPVARDERLEEVEDLLDLLPGG